MVTSPSPPARVGITRGTKAPGRSRNRIGPRRSGAGHRWRSARKEVRPAWVGEGWDLCRAQWSERRRHRLGVDPVGGGSPGFRTSDGVSGRCLRRRGALARGGRGETPAKMRAAISADVGRRRRDYRVLVRTELKRRIAKSPARMTPREEITRRRRIAGYAAARGNGYGRAFGFSRNILADAVCKSP